MSELFLRPLFDWRSALASPFGPKNPTTRHVLLTLSLHMSVKGDSCFPSIDLLTEESALSRRAVLQHLATAAGDGWLGKRERPEKNGQGWRRIEYFPLIPQGVEERVKARMEERGARRAPAQGGARGAKGGAPGASKVVHDVHPSTSSSSSKSTVAGQADASPVASLFRTYQAGIKRLYEAEYPPSAKANGQLANVVKQLGAERAGQALGYYLGSAKPYYATRKHALDVFVRDAADLCIAMQQAAGGRVGQAATTAHAYIEYIDSERARITEYPVGEPFEIAKTFAREYASKVNRENVTSVMVRIGNRETRWKPEELR